MLQESDIINKIHSKRVGILYNMYSIVKSIATLLLPAADTVRVQYSDRVSELSVSCGKVSFTRMLGKLLLLIKSDLRS